MSSRLHKVRGPQRHTTIGGRTIVEDIPQVHVDAGSGSPGIVTVEIPSRKVQVRSLTLPIGGVFDISGGAQIIGAAPIRITQPKLDAEGKVVPGEFVTQKGAEILYTVPFTPPGDQEPPKAQ